MSPPIIVCAAIKYGNQILTGPRHFHCLRQLELFDYLSDMVCGFVDQDNQFYTRVQAYIIAQKNGQIRNPGYNAGSNELYSENLY